MSDFEVQIADLGESAGAARSAASGLRGLHSESGLSAGAAAIPGSKSAGLLASVASRWTQMFTGMATDLDGYADLLERAATNYERSEQGACEDFGAARRPARGAI